MLLASGFAPKAAALVYATSARYVRGFAVQLRRDDTAEPLESAAVSVLYHGLDASRFPATIAVADCLPAQTLEDEFRFGLRLMVASLVPLRDAATD